MRIRKKILIMTMMQMWMTVKSARRTESVIYVAIVKTKTMIDPIRDAKQVWKL